MLADKTIGDGSPNKKTMGVRNARENAVKSGFNYAPNSAFTRAFFNEFIGRSGARGERGEKALKLVCETPFKPSEEDALLSEYYRFPKNGFASPSVYVRADDPWGTSMGLGFSGVAYDRTQFLYAVKRVLASQFHRDVIAFKEFKGITEDFGMLLMQAYLDFKSSLPGPKTSVNFLGKINGQMLVQYSYGFYNPDRSNGMHISEERFNYPCKDHVLYGFDKCASGLVQLGGPCSLEAVRSNISGKDTWTYVQWEQHPIQGVQPPAVDAKSIFYFGNNVVGTAAAVTDKTVLWQSAPFGIDTEEFARNQGFIAHNRSNKGYLFLASIDRIRSIADIPLEAYSNAGAIVLYVYDIQREFASHLNGRMRALGIPIIIIEAGTTNVSGAWEQLINGGKFVFFADEFGKDGPSCFIARA